MAWAKRLRAEPRRPIVAALAALSLGGCLFDPPKTYMPPPEDPEVASRCTPVRALLAKNYHRGASADLGIVSGGAVTDIRGAVLSPEEAARIARMDYFCRAWVAGAISDVDYGRVLFGAASIAVIEDTDAGNRGKATALVVAIMEQLKARGIIPAVVTPATFPARVEADAGFSTDALERRFAALAGETAVRFGREREDETTFRADVIARLDKLEHALAPAIAPADRGAAVYFATGSSELTHDAQLRLSAGAQLWSRAGSGVRVIGYADARGSRRANLALSRRRAMAVAAALNRLGVRVRQVVGAGAAADDIAADGAQRMVRIESD